MRSFPESPRDWQGKCRSAPVSGDSLEFEPPQLSRDWPPRERRRTAPGDRVASLPGTPVAFSWA